MRTLKCQHIIVSNTNTDQYSLLDTKEAIDATQSPETRKLSSSSPSKLFSPILRVSNFVSSPSKSASKTTLIHSSPTPGFIDVSITLSVLDSTKKGLNI